MSTDPSTAPGPRTAGLRLHRWTDRAVVGVALTTFASGFAQFGVVAALGDVARGFGNVTHGPTFADQAGLSGTELGIGLAIIRLASLGGLPITGLADRFGRRMMLLITVGAGLALPLSDPPPTPLEVPPLAVLLPLTAPPPLVATPLLT